MRRCLCSHCHRTRQCCCRFSRHWSAGRRSTCWEDKLGVSLFSVANYGWWLFTSLFTLRSVDWLRRSRADLANGRLEMCWEAWELGVPKELNLIRGSDLNISKVVWILQGIRAFLLQNCGANCKKASKTKLWMHQKMKIFRRCLWKIQSEVANSLNMFFFSILSKINRKHA